MPACIQYTQTHTHMHEDLQAHICIYTQQQTEPASNTRPSYRRGVLFIREALNFHATKLTQLLSGQGGLASYEF